MNQHQIDILYQNELSLIVEKQEYNLFATLKPSIYKDGNQWCVLYGEYLHDGIAGFGDTPYLAILDFNKQFSSPISSSQAIDKETLNTKK